MVLDMEVDSALVEELASHIAQDIEWEIMSRSLVLSGWHKVDLEETTYPLNDIEQVKVWVEANVTGNYQTRSNRWVFENEKDATLFRLRWN